VLLYVEHEKIVSDLAVAISLRGSAQEFVRLAIVDPVQQPRFLRDLSLDLRSADAAARLIVSLCLKDGWTATPCWLVLILKYLNVMKQDLALSVLIQRIESKIDPTPDPFNNLWLDKVPFFDRVELRPLARTFLTSTSVAILRVNGPSGAGTSYTARVLQELVRDSPHRVKIVSATIPQASATVFQLEDLVADLALPYGEMPPSRTVSSYPTEMARWLLRKAIQQPETQVLVIDGAGADGVNDEIRLFITTIAERICDHSVRSRVRMVLLNFQPKLPRLLLADESEEKLRPARELSATDVSACLRALAERRESQGQATLPASIDALAVEILAEAPFDGAERLRHVHERLYQLSVY
jgi:hypothetical protein